jgi:hypothetical protein
MKTNLEELRDAATGAELFRPKLKLCQGQHFRSLSQRRQIKGE